jgi:hypothetical protein
VQLRAFTGRPAANAANLTGHAINPALQPLLSCIPALTLVEAYAKASDYRHGQAFVHALTQVVDPALVARLRKDFISLTADGLTRLDPAACDHLRDRYADHDHPAAREILTWLAGEHQTNLEVIMPQ